MDAKTRSNLRQRMKVLYESASEDFFYFKHENEKQWGTNELKEELNKLGDSEPLQTTASNDGVPCFMLKHDYDLENLVCDRVDLEFLDPNDVLIDVYYVGINFSDIYSIKGLFHKKKLPYIPGIECSGIVLAVGSEVPLFKKGDMVMVFNPDGGLLKDKVVVNKNCVFHCTNLIKGAAIPVSYLTALEIICASDLFQSFGSDSGNLSEKNQNKKKILFHNCGGGVGSAFYDLTKFMNVKLLGTCSLPKQKFVAYECYRYENWNNEVKYRHPEGVDMVIETISGSNTNKSLGVLRQQGHLFIIGATAILDDNTKLEEGAYLNAEKIIMKNISATGINIHTLFEAKPEYVRKMMDFVTSLLKENIINPSIGGIFQFDEVVDAIKYMMNRQNIGKVLVQIKHHKK